MIDMTVIISVFVSLVVGLGIVFYSKFLAVSFDDEFDTSLRFAGGGVLAMANSGPDTQDSQFFITEVTTPWLNDLHTIFAQIISGDDVFQQIIRNAPCDYHTSHKLIVLSQILANPPGHAKLVFPCSVKIRHVSILL